MSKYVKRFLGEKEPEKTSEFSSTVEPAVKLDIANTMHQTMALSISNIAKVYPKQFDMIKHILTQYAFLLEHILVFRSTGNPNEFFKKLSEFIIRSVEGYLEQYEDGEIVDEEKKVKDLIMDGLVNIEEAIILNEGIDLSNPEKPTVSRRKPSEDWSGKPTIKKRGGLPSIDMPIEELKGIGAETAKKLREIGVDTLSKYVAYQEAQLEDSKNSEEDKQEDE